jgi:N-glycosylase/DNA lyase
MVRLGRPSYHNNAPMVASAHHPAPPPAATVSGPPHLGFHATSGRLAVDATAPRRPVSPPDEHTTVELHWPDGLILQFPWGPAAGFGSAAYWTLRARQVGVIRDHRLGADLREEVAACILGGYGIPAEIGLAAFRRVRSAGLLGGATTVGDLQALLSIPLCLGQRRVKYRFPRQRATWLATALAQLDAMGPAPADPIPLRSYLARVPGVGPKISSQIVRNFLGSDDVAIIDVHVRRAGIALGCFRPEWRLPGDYARFEQAIRSVATIAGVSTATLDAVIWDEIRRLGCAASRLLGDIARGKLVSTV